MSKYGTPSTTPPTEPGWYWVALHDGEILRKPAPAQISQGFVTGKLFVSDKAIRRGYDVLLKVDEKHLWWPIPIEVPEVPK